MKSYSSIFQIRITLLKASKPRYQNPLKLQMTHWFGWWEFIFRYDHQRIWKIWKSSYILSSNDNGLGFLIVSTSMLVTIVREVLSSFYDYNVWLHMLIKLFPLKCIQKTKNYEILRTLENKDNTSRTIVNSVLFPVRKSSPIPDT